MIIFSLNGGTIVCLIGDNDDDDHADDMSTMMMMMMKMIMTVMTVTMFNLFHEGLVDNKWYVSACGFSDNNRLKTWMPYVVNKVGLLLFLFLFFLRLTTSDCVKKSEKY